MKKFIIHIEDNIDDLTAFTLIKEVIKDGKISQYGNGKDTYCRASLFYRDGEQIAIVNKQTYRETVTFKCVLS